MSKIVCLFAVKMFDCMKFGSFASIGFPPISKSIDNAIHFDHGRKERDDPLSLSVSPSHRFENVIRTIDDSINRGYSRVNRVDRDYFIRAMNAIASGKICII